MKIRMQYGKNNREVDWQEWSIGFYGDVVDERGEEATNFVIKNTISSYKVTYSPSNFTFNMENEDLELKEIDIFFSQFNKETTVILDITTLGVVETLLILQSLYNNGLKQFDCIYLEPAKYKNTSIGKIIHRRDFELTSGFAGYIGIPGHTLYMSPQTNDKFIFLCGYESERIERAVEDLNINTNRCQLFFGIPAFHSGWEMNSFSNTLRVIENRNLGNSFYYCGASNPLAVFEKLSMIYYGLNADEQMFLVPIGTKPMALGACIFKVIKNDKKRLAILYDHPKKVENRSSKVARWNLYNIEL